MSDDKRDIIIVLLLDPKLLPVAEFAAEFLSTEIRGKNLATQIRCRILSAENPSKKYGYSNNIVKSTLQ